MDIEATKGFLESRANSAREDALRLAGDIIQAMQNTQRTLKDPDDPWAIESVSSTDIVNLHRQIALFAERRRALEMLDGKLPAYQEQE